MVDSGGEASEREVSVGTLRRVGNQPPAPTVRGQQVQSLIEEDAPARTGGELAALIVEPINAFNNIHCLPRLARPQQRARKGNRVEWYIVLPEELKVLHVRPVLPPLAPIPSARIRIGPFLGSRDVLDRCIEPNI